MKKTISVFILITTAFFSCKKDNGSSATKTELLVAGKWQLTGANFSESGVTVLDFYSTYMTSCQTDNFYTFNSNNTVTVDEGATKCADTAAQSTTTGSWSLTDGDTKFNISGIAIVPGVALNTTIVQLDNTTIKLSKDTTISILGSGTINLTFTNKK
jgi:hypothetical protein